MEFRLAYSLAPKTEKQLEKKKDMLMEREWD